MDTININTLNGNITFTTLKKGMADLKKDGGVIRGRHKVAVTLRSNLDHKDLAGLDLIRLKNADLNALRLKAEKKLGTIADDDWEDALRGTLPRKKGLIISLHESSLGDNEDNKHLEAYEPHPCGVSGVVIHKTTGEIHIRGIIVKEEILEADPLGDARKVDSGLHVRIKNFISKEMDLHSSKWRQYALPASVEIVVG